MSVKQKFLNYYETHATKVDVSVFLGGFLFDVFFLSSIDDLFGLAQNVVYLIALAALLYFDFLHENQKLNLPKFLVKPWEFRKLAIHFILGSLLSVYSLFFFKSASLFNSIAFVLLLMFLMVANETRFLQDRKLNIKVALFFLLLFSFFSMMIPTFLGFVGWFPFLLAALATTATLYGATKKLIKVTNNLRLVRDSLIIPGGTIVILFIGFYIFGLIPPVPISIENIGIYHKIEKVGDVYEAHYDRAHTGLFSLSEKTFVAEPGDKINLFVQIYSPAKFSDAVTLHWYYKDKKQGWITADKIPMQIRGGRQEGYRGSFVKQNYQEGEWRVSVETTDGREIGRHYFDVKITDKADSTRELGITHH